ncbi:capsid protein [Streptococcus lutetiensis]|nr:capsid protein [Streptococcus lutetiensis]MBT0901319.1 capsid protein [Streptococcus lutetiensis]QMS96461.1 capsid protein [Streptococcus equinus]HEP3614009.1 capsid protein [Streptococcus pyogenes]HEP5544981.1 capsid protein [Streptococcus pyogenes]
MSKRPVLNDQQFSLKMQGVSDIYAQMQQELFDNMIKRLIVRGSADLQENPYIWQMQKLNDMHMLNEENLKIITERTGIAEDLLRDVIANEGLKVYKDTKQQLAEDLGRRDGEYIANGVTDSLEAYTSQAISDLNLINTTLPRSIQKTYKSIVEKSVAEVVISSKSADKAIRDTIMKWQKKNFTGFVDKGGREWRADAYARAIIKTTTFRVYNEMRTAPAKEMGIDTYYYSKKATAREMCAPLQGRIVTMEGMTHTEQGVKVLALSDYGYGYAGGCLGVHCGHYLTPFIIGVNELPEDPDYLKDLTPEQAEENARIQAKQRALERAIRNQKERLHIASQLGDDELITSERLKLRNLQGKMRAYVDQHGFLHRDYSRERLFSTQNSYEKNKTLLRTKKKTLEKQREVKSAIIGMKTSNNIKIKDVSKHLVDRAVERKVETQTIIDALKNPLEIKEIKYDEYGRPSQKFIGKDTSVVINPSTGNIATTHKTGKRIRRKYGFEK